MIADRAPVEVILIDNQDSFTFNLVESFQRIGARVRVYRNDVPAEHVVELAHTAPAERIEHGASAKR